MPRRALRTFLAPLLAVAACGVPPEGDPAVEVDVEESALLLPPPLPSLAQLAASYSNYDKDGDGIREIEELKLSSVDRADAARSAGTVLVLVEQRLITGGRSAEILQRLATYRDDLAVENFTARIVEARVYAGANDQDGHTVLALRDFLKAVRGSIPSLKGAVLVGSFPEAVLILRAMKRYDNVKWDWGAGETTGNDVLRVIGGRINPRSDLVLGDLDGNWEAVYRRTPRQIPQYAIRMNGAPEPWPNAGSSYSSTTYEYAEGTWQDFFEIRDEAIWTAGPQPDAQGRMRLTLYVGATAPDNREVSTADRSLANPIARPEIIVSRVNARGVAMEPNMPPDINGATPLNAAGYPRTVTYLNWGAPTKMEWAHSFALEQQLIIEYLDRNHAFRRLSVARPPYRVSSVRSLDATGDRPLEAPTSYNQYLMTAGSGWQSPIATDYAELDDYVTWLKSPAVLRGVMAHSSTTDSAFPSPADLTKLDTAIGSRPFAWKRTVEGSYVKFTPDASALSNADWATSRTVWKNFLLGSREANGSIWMHQGCDVVNPPGSENTAYTDAGYDRMSNGNSVLFFLNGVALYGRAKVFYDKPNGFPAALAPSTANLGSGVRGQFAADAGDANLAKEPYARKRAYFWSLLGDWTLRVKY